VFNINRAGFCRTGSIVVFLTGGVGQKIDRDGVVRLIDPRDNVTFLWGQIYFVTALLDVDCNGVLGSGSTGYKATN